jgi:hypothetical protein
MKIFRSVKHFVVIGKVYFFVLGIAGVYSVNKCVAKNVSSYIKTVSLAGKLFGKVPSNLSVSSKAIPASVVLETIKRKS